MKIILIVAVDKQWGIGKDNDLMWHLPADMRFFKETTSGHIVVLGRKNYESIPERFRPLPNRENAILTRNSNYQAPGCLMFHSLESCLDHYKNETERFVFIIGGGEIYSQAINLNVVDEMYITFVDETYNADTFFPQFSENDWTKELFQIQEPDERHTVGFKIYKFQNKKENK